jgi:hypothetical protein
MPLLVFLAALRLGTLDIPLGGALARTEEEEERQREYAIWVIAPSHIDEDEFSATQYASCSG